MEVAWCAEGLTGKEEERSVPGTVPTVLMSIGVQCGDRISIPLSEFRWEASRAGGPGGQNVNKVNSKVLLRWNPAASPSLPEPVRVRLLEAIGSRLTRDGELLVSSQASRDQARNLADCLAKVRALVQAAAKPPKIRHQTRPTRASQVRRVEQKNRRSATKRLRRPPDPD
jgi:ribosome-associated protein